MSDNAKDSKSLNLAKELFDQLNRPDMVEQNDKLKRGETIMLSCRGEVFECGMIVVDPSRVAPNLNQLTQSPQYTKMLLSKIVSELELYFSGKNIDKLSIDERGLFEEIVYYKNELAEETGTCVFVIIQDDPEFNIIQKVENMRITEQVQICVQALSAQNDFKAGKVSEKSIQWELREWEEMQHDLGFDNKQ